MRKSDLQVVAFMRVVYERYPGSYTALGLSKSTLDEAACGVIASPREVPSHTVSLLLPFNKTGK